MIMSISMMLIVLSLVQINASQYRSIRQVTTDACPLQNIVFCDFVNCVNGRCVENRTIAECYTCQCDVGFTGKLCETTIVTPSGCNLGCQNGGRCELVAANTYICVCPPEYTGAQCETSALATNPCVTTAGAICQNGGSCIVIPTNIASYLCNCAAGWSGTNCQIQETTTQCNPTICGAHGTCIQAVAPTGPVVFCNCDNRWTGKACDVNLDLINCPVGYCLSGGTCIVNGNIPLCQCPPTHTGQRCETVIGTLTTVTPVTTMTTTSTITNTTVSTITPIPGRCTANSCLNGGSCYNTGNSFICLCNSLWSGPTCSVPNSMTTTLPTTSSNINGCQPNPCYNGGSCYRYGSSYVCVCTSQFTGPTCSLAKTTTVPAVTTSNPGITCANQPCQNGGTCYNSGSSYFCYCGPNNTYTGKNCETMSVPLAANCPLDCSPGYCVNSGGIQSAYACMCNGILTPTRCVTK